MINVNRKDKQPASRLLIVSTCTTPSGIVERGTIIDARAFARKDIGTLVVNEQAIDADSDEAKALQPQLEKEKAAKEAAARVPVSKAR